MLWTNFENLNSISNIFQGTYDFLILTDLVIICFYLKATGRHFRDQWKLRHATLKLLKCYLVQRLNTFRNTSFADFWCREGISCFLQETSTQFCSFIQVFQIISNSFQVVERKSKFKRKNTIKYSILGNYILLSSEEVNNHFHSCVIRFLGISKKKLYIFLRGKLFSVGTSFFKRIFFTYDSLLTLQTQDVN